jgi:hypothetical protein
VKLSTIGIGLAGTAVLLSLGACGTTAITHGERVFSFRGTDLVIDDPSSDLNVVPGSGSGVEVQRWLSGTAAKPDHSSWGLDGDTLRLNIRCSGLVFHCGSRFKVAVPPNVSVVVHSGPGNVRVSGLPGMIKIDGGSGQVQLRDTSGPLQINTDSGDITASDIRSPFVRTRSDEGSTDIGFTAGPQLVEVRSMIGNATVEIPTTGYRYHVLVTTGSGSAQSKVRDDRQSKSSVQVSSRNGNARVLPAREGDAPGI